jgi:cytochrome c
MASCGNDNASDANNTNTGTDAGTGTDAQTTDAPATQQASNADAEKGMELIAQSDCLACHKVDEKLVGPSYKEVAQRYANQQPAIVDSLAGKIITGGAGNWGQVAMTPHPALSKDDAKLMVTYILSLK